MTLNGKQGSLSMKLRVESITNGAAIEEHRKSQRLPTIERPKFVTGKQFNAPKTESIYERLSGTYQFENSMGVMADRQPIVHPTALCVRCSSTASVCMGCTELLCNNAVLFFRRSRSQGASALFTNAIKEAGMSKATLFMIFKLWKNGYQLRRRADLKMKHVVERMFGNSCLFTPFKAWHKFTKENLLMRKEKKMQELTQKVASSEFQVRELNKDKAKMEAKIKKLQARIDETENKFADNRTFIRELHQKIAEERMRVLGLSQMVEVTLETMKQYHDLSRRDLGAVGAQLLRSTAIVPAHDYSEVFTDTDRRNVAINRAQRVDRNYSTANEFLQETSIETAVSVSMMLKWINWMSWRCSNKICDGESVDAYLNPYEELSKFDLISNGKQLSRVVVCLIYDSLDPTNTMIHDGVADGEANSFGVAQLKELQRFSNSSFFLTACCVQYTSRYLDIAPFDLHGLRADIDVFKAFIHSLMLIANPVLTQKESQSQDAFVQYYESAQTALNKLTAEVEAMEPLQMIREKSEAIYGKKIHYADNLDPGSPDGRSDSIDLASTLQVAAGELSIEPNAKSTEASAISPKVNGEASFEDEIIRSVYPHEARGAKYDELAAAVSNFLNDGENAKSIRQVVVRSQATATTVVELRQKLQSLISQKAIGIRLTSDVTNHLHSYNTEVMLRKLKWVSDKLDEMPDVPFEIK